MENFLSAPAFAGLIAAQFLSVVLVQTPTLRRPISRHMESKCEHPSALAIRGIR
jgi:ABC-type transport system involved in cytochrome bd biosynthesis fused ATPase/permease subunit